MSLIAACPVTGQDVFPDTSGIRIEGSNTIMCPACGREHEWDVLGGRLIDVSDDVLVAKSSEGVSSEYRE